MMTSAQVVETSVTTTDNSPSQDYTHPDDQTTLLQKKHWIFLMRWPTIFNFPLEKHFPGDFDNKRTALFCSL